jgi:hypothetical protein
MSDKDRLIYALAGLSVWLNGALTFRLGGRFLFENGHWVALLAAVVIALLVCLVFRACMGWRKAPASQAVTVAVIMALPGLFGETARQLVFGWATGMGLATQPAFAATIFFGNAVLLTYAAVKERRGM